MFCKYPAQISYRRLTVVPGQHGRLGGRAAGPSVVCHVQRNVPHDSHGKSHDHQAQRMVAHVLCYTQDRTQKPRATGATSTANVQPAAAHHCAVPSWPPCFPSGSRSPRNICSHPDAQHKVSKRQAVMQQPELGAAEVAAAIGYTAGGQSGGRPGARDFSTKHAQQLLTRLSAAPLSGALALG